MSIDTPEELKALKACAQVTKETLNVLQKAVQPGITTKMLEHLADDIFANYGARSAPRLIYNLPATVLISLNDEAVHGLPGERVIRAGDIVKIDVTPELNGFITDACVTIAVPPVKPETSRLLEASQEALRKAMGMARAGLPVNLLGKSIEKEVRKRGFSVIRELGGHGVGRRIHEAPEVMNFYHRGQRERLQEGMVITIEPIIAQGSGKVYTAKDGWTIKTQDQSPVAHFEHTIVITRNKPLILTA
ncbi:MAG: type I methionyl aminopeptidase [Trueperaceae bacterium]|nr:type I methionyl aminopeptidase [Trueperaceae bacterium]